MCSCNNDVLSLAISSIFSSLNSFSRSSTVRRQLRPPNGPRWLRTRGRWACKRCKSRQIEGSKQATVAMCIPIGSGTMIVHFCDMHTGCDMHVVRICALGANEFDTGGVVGCSEYPYTRLAFELAREGIDSPRARAQAHKEDALSSRCAEGCHGRRASCADSRRRTGAPTRGVR